MRSGRNLYVFLDESGNFDFSPTGSKYFILTAVITTDPLQGVADVLAWRHHVLTLERTMLGTRKPRDYTHFHCTEDAQYARDGMFRIIAGLQIEAYSVVVQKNKANPSIRTDHVFYEKVFKGLVPYIVRRHGSEYAFHIFASEINVRRKRAALMSSLKGILNEEKVQYNLHLHPNHSHHLLQVSDYVCWAVARKWETGDSRPHASVAAKIRSEFDLFARGTTTYY
ncbi:MAG TPA: DUF3800 domain-containing protein [Candidatus Dormibacteraeota bacterium]|nr:DUF3800 domain-containing protein [Candidatus Dormibacteraeota bacterium]